MGVRIFRPAKTAMQSGTANAKRWLLEFEPDAPRVIEPVMGWTSSGDTERQVRMRFTSKDEAIAFAKKHGLEHRVSEPKRRTLRPRSYSDNFRHDRIT